MDGRTMIRQVTPPFVMTGARRVRARFHQAAPSWEFVGYDWPEDSGGGWNSAGVVRAYQAKLSTYRRAIRSPQPIGVPTEALMATAPSLYDQNLALQYAYAVARAGMGRDRVSILDWGGGYGFMAFLVAELFPDLRVDFHVKEVPAVASAARREVADVTYWEDDSCFDRTFDLVTSSSALQYERHWTVALERFGAVSSFVLLQRTPVTPNDRSFVTRQWAYGTNYLGWVFGREELVGAARTARLELEREFIEGWSAPIPDAPSANVHAAFLFKKVERA
jgi:putative methyltransferase (TIGR04325 family)